MAEIAAQHSAELKPRSNRDDYFITGFLRERLPWVSLRSGEVLWRSPVSMYLDIPRQLEGGAWGAVWDGLLSRCTWLGVTKNVFFNNFVVNKGSGNVSYVQVS